MKLWKTNTILLIIAAIIIILPLVFLPQAEFGGADAMATETIEDLAPDYQPWFSPVFEIPSGEVESLLFALQAALGAGVIGFVLGRITLTQKKEG